MKHFAIVCLILAACTPTPPPSTDTAPPVQARGDDIVGGINDTRREYVVGIGDSSSAFCSGTLISKRVIITAGHCFEGITTVYTGNTFDGPTLAVRKSTRHPGFSEDTLANDLTVVELEADAPFQPAPLLRENMNDAVASFVGPAFTFVGYGDAAGHHGFGTRRVATFPINAVGPATLTDGITIPSIDATMFYYKLDNKNTCNGDSGGPAFIARKGVERHAGVTSFGDAACTQDGVQQRTDAAAITGFIQGMIDSIEGPDNACRSNGVCDESCQTDGKIVDPDCAENHCGKDGVCALSCVQPVDPDCAGNVCGADGVCDPSCTTRDPDCAP